MNRLIIILALTVILAGCKEGGKGEYFDFDSLTSPYIEGLTVHNYPKMDGSTSTEPLNAVIACTLFDIDYKWADKYIETFNIKDIKPDLNENDTYKFKQLFKSSQTHLSIIKLIDGEADLILVARTMSQDEKTHADAAGVSLIETPIALDALVFIVNPYNFIESLTTQQIQDIYTLNITTWDELGYNLPWPNEFGWNATWSIVPYVRNPNSGSQELMETLAMKDAAISDFPLNEMEVIASMSGVYEKVLWQPYAICYTIYYYKEYMVVGDGVKSIAINGIYADRETIGDRSYPYTAEVYAAIRSDLDTSSMAYKLYEWLQTPEGKQTISNSGYIPYNGE
jgi:phosphate transport system substrate-binding protein